MATNGSKASLDLKPVALIAGLIAAPIASGAIGRTFITPKENLKTEAEADAEMKRLIRNFAIYNAIVAGGLGYAGSRKDLSQGWRSAAIGGAVGTGLVAALLGTVLVTAPKAEQVEPPTRQPGQFGPGTGNRITPQTWTSTFVGYPR